MSTHPGPALPDNLKKLSSYRSRFGGHRGNRDRHPSALIRIVTKGSPTPDGRRVRLRAVRFGGAWWTCDEWVEQYVVELTAAHLPADGPGVDGGLRSPAERRRESAEAARNLEAMGA